MVRTRAILLGLSLLATLPACASLKSQQVVNTTTLTYLTHDSADAAMDTLAAWAQASEAFEATPTDSSSEGQVRMVIRDVRRGQDNTARVHVRSLDNLTEVRIRSHYRIGNPARYEDVAFSLYNRLGSRVYARPADGRAPCQSVEEWRQRRPTPALGPDAEPSDNQFPVLVGGLVGLSSRTIFPPAALAEGKEGTVSASFVVLEDGSVSCITIVSSPDPGFSMSALQVLRQSRFEPGRINGVPVKVRYTLPIRYVVNRGLRSL